MSGDSPHKYPPDPLPPILIGATINLLAGAPGVGKSTFLAWFCRQLKERKALWGREWGTVPWQGIICADRSWERSTSRWFDLEGVRDLPAYSMQDDPKFRKSRLRKRHDRISIFEHCLKELSPAKDGQFELGSLVYVDPLALFLGGNLLDYDTCLVACSELREICLERGITIVGTAHASKQKADKKDRYLRLQDRILGSAALFGYTDTQMYIASPDEIDKPYYAFLWCPHHAPTSTFKFTRDRKDGRFVPGEALEDSGFVTGAEESIEEEIPWLTEALDEGPKSFSQLIALATEHEMSRATLNRRLQTMERQGIVNKPRYGEYAKVVKH